MGYQVIEADGGNLKRAFLNLSGRIYAGDPYYIPPIGSYVKDTLDADKNPYFRNSSLRLFLCLRNGIAVARTAIVINCLYLQSAGEKIAFFGFFEAENDPQAVSALFRHAGQYCKVMGATVLEGPYNPNHYSDLGLQTEAFDKPPAFFQTHNPPYYESLLASAGFTRSFEIHTRKNTGIKQFVERNFGGTFSSASESGFRARQLNLNNLGEELERVRDVYNDAFASNWRFLPVSAEEYAFSAKYIKYVTSPELNIIVEKDGIPHGVLQCVYDINPLMMSLRGVPMPLFYLNFMRKRKKSRNLIIYAGGVRKSARHSEVTRLLFDALCRISLGFDSLETTWMYDDNSPAVRIAEALGLIRDRTFWILSKRLE